jgi:tRNA dimethylallyltransferase
MEKAKVVIIAGPTASGKSALAAELAMAFNGEVVSADSMQVYKYMDIGTAKPSKETLESVPHHLIDVVDPDSDYTAASFRKDAIRKIREINGRGRSAFIAGGTGLYIKALTKGLFDGPAADKSLREGLRREAEERGAEHLYNRLREVDPVSAESIHQNNIVRIIRALEVYESSGRPISEFHREHGFHEDPFDAVKVGITKERALLYGDIEKRVDRMMADGLPEETERLLNMGYGPHLKPMRALGYREMTGYINGELGLDEAVGLLKKNTRNYAKRQMTWFRNDPGIIWFSPEQKKDIMELVERHLS